MIHNLQNAINEKFKERLLINKTQWYSKQQDRPVNTWVVRQVVWDEDKQRDRNVELFSSTSQIQVVLFLRDYWYELNNWQVPRDNEMWEAAKKAYAERKAK